MTEKQKAEAIFRMTELTRKFRLDPNLADYVNRGYTFYSYMNFGFLGCIDTIEYETKYAEMKKAFEKETGAFVYHAIETKTAHFGNSLSLLYVSADGKGEEAYISERLDDNRITAHVIDLKDGHGEDITITLDGNNGALVRIDTADAK